MLVHGIRDRSPNDLFGSADPYFNIVVEGGGDGWVGDGKWLGVEITRTRNQTLFARPVSAFDSLEEAQKASFINDRV